MTLAINSNVSSLNALRTVQRVQSSADAGVKRLSSGLRVNSASDDPAGLAVAQRMSAQSKGALQAVRNVSDGVSLLQTAESSLQTVTNLLQRMRALAVQSINASNNALDRAALKQEMQKLIGEIDRIASQTTFNGQRVLDGSLSAVQLQAGVHNGETLTMNLSTSLRAAEIGKTTDYVNVTAYNPELNIGQQGKSAGGASAPAGTLAISVGSGPPISVGASANYAGSATGQEARSAYAKAAAINAAGVPGLTATADTTLQVAFSTVNSSTSPGDTYYLMINLQNIFFNATTVLDGAAFASAINSKAAITGVTASFSGSSNVMTLRAADGRNIWFYQSIGAGGTSNEGFLGSGAG
jgi:flagellin